MPRFNEKSVVEDYIVDELVKRGWSYVPGNALERDSFDEPILTRILIKQLKEINAVDLSDEDIKTVINELRFKPSTQEGIKQILTYFKEGISIKLEKDRTLKKIKLFDYVDVKNNDLIVTRQAVYTRGDKQIRTDIILYINGIPLVDVECKNPASFSENWYDAFKQIKSYEQDIPELYKYIQIGVAAEQTAKYFPIVPWNDNVRIDEWKSGEFDPVDSIVQMLIPETLLDIINNFVYARTQFGEATKVLPRYMQYRAVNKVVQRVLNNIRGIEEKNKGLIWHWQGSGKTLEMIFAANKLYRSETMENPTLFLIVDRQDLEEQLYDEFTALELTIPELIGSVTEMRKVLQHDDGRGKRGIFITLIHKFRPEELSVLQKELEKLSSKKETILTRKNVVAFVDEGHRTQYGTLAAQMRAILRNTSFFAFTGTPVSKPKHGVDTYDVFSYPPEEKYLDKYFITDSINDGFTVKIAYQPRLEKEVHLNKEMLDTFLDVEFEEIPEDTRDVVKEDVKKKISLMKAYLENPQRIAKVAKDIAEHFKESVDGKFKAMVVAVNRESCELYKRELDKHLPKEYSEVVISFGARNEPERLQLYVKEKTAQYGKEFEDIRKDVIENFKEEQLPKIMIVTDMLLTGFDAPILQTMYLDKPLKEHRLLQAVARTNRPYKDVKEAGLILDYIGILKEFKRAFEIYSKEEINGALYSIEEIRKEFVQLVNKLLDIFKEVPKNQYDRQTMLKAIRILTSNDQNSKTFLDDYKHMTKIFELLGPDTIKAELFSEYQWISAIYTYYTRLVLRSQAKDNRYFEQYFKKTIKYIHKTTELEEIQKSLPIIEFDENYFRKLEQHVKNKEEKAANIVFTLNRFVLVDKFKNPVSESLSEKVQRLLELWKEKTKDYEKVYQEGVKTLKEFMDLSKRQKELNLSKTEYSILLVLEDKYGEDEQLLKDISELSESLKELIYPGWASQPTAQKEVEKTIRLFMRRYIKRYNQSLDDINLLCEKLIDRVKAYAKEN
ncbi:TPA: HsdR family type I site-specific deoxyribonuclease [Candidatus Woesearchaeota archaeon]|nr:HsdR family type I site-specific deoxyribonuclease [Candidatus Woesearchaeota archaeon]HIH31510.1 HsdR family type I site-specific deoxyribonuclease [Candidatus Woesearchaeota archaeon]HIH54187.1 HsdR family type I site-specific deoxyribonuclease [Candidatus Woesearchaeota archaeon]